MHCPTCTAPPQQLAKRHGVQVHVCSEACGHQLLAGNSFDSSANLVHVDAQSPIGQVIATHTGLVRTKFALPADVVSRIGASMQRIGPQQKRAADAADLEESTQAAAPVQVAPTESVALTSAASSDTADTPIIDWASSLPADAWSIILGMLSPADIGRFGASGRRAAAHMRERATQVSMVRANVSPRKAVRVYLDAATPESRKDTIRRVYPHIAEMCVARLCVYQWIDHPTNDRLFGRLPWGDEFDALFQAMRNEADLDGDKLYARPIHAATIGGYEGDIVLIMFSAIQWFVRSYRTDWIRSKRNLDSILAKTTSASTEPRILETPETISFFATKLVIGEPKTNNIPVLTHLSEQLLGLTFSLEPLRKYGIDINRHNFIVWFFHTISDSIWWRGALGGILAANPTLNAPLPTVPGQLSALMLAMTLKSTQEWLLFLIGIMDNKNQLIENLTTPAIFGDSRNESVLFACDYPNVIRSVFGTLLQFISGTLFTMPTDNHPLTQRNAAGQTPIEKLLAAWRVFDIDTFIGKRILIEASIIRPLLFAPLAANPSVPAISILPPESHAALIKALCHGSWPQSNHGLLYAQYLLSNFESITYEEKSTRLKLLKFLLDEGALSAADIIALKPRWTAVKRLIPQIFQTGDLEFAFVNTFLQ